MGLLDRVKGFFSFGTRRQQQQSYFPKQKESFFKRALGGTKKSVAKNQLAKAGMGGNPLSELEPTPDFGGSRTSIPKFSQGGGGGFGALPKKTQRELGLDETQLQSSSVEDLMDRLMDAHPDVSYALWNFLRIGNGNYTLEVLKPNGKPYPKGVKHVEEFIHRLSLPNVMQFESSRELEKVLNQLMQSVVTRGACALELVLTPGMDDVAFIAPVDPATIAFKFEQDRYVPYQDEEKLSLDIPTFFYEALDERIDDPYGRSPLLGAINMVMFQLQVLNDIKAVVHNQGYPRFDIKILEEVLLKRMPISIRNNEQKKSKWLNDKLQEIIEMYNNLDPDDAFVHYDSVEVDTAGGGKGGGALIDPEKLMKAIDGLILGGLKTVSTVLGKHGNGSTESFAKMEIKLYLRGVEAIQQVVERLISRALTLMLNIKGQQGIVKFKYEPVEIRTELEKAQFEQIMLQNIAYKRDQGWIDQNMASNEAVGADAISEPNWEALGGTSTVKNADGSAIGGQKDEKGTSSSTESTSSETNN